MQDTPISVTIETMITLKVRKATMGWEKIIGLIGKNQVYSLLIETRFGIHTFGVRTPIDILILDKNYVVKNIVIGMKPYRIFVWNPLYPYVVELPEGTIMKEKIKKGEKMTLMLY